MCVAVGPVERQSEHVVDLVGVEDTHPLAPRVDGGPLEEEEGGVSERR